MALDQILARLVENELEFVLIGGYAAVLHGSPIPTLDVDVCLKFSKENLNRLAAAFGDLHPKHRITPQKLPLEITDRSWIDWKNIYLQTDLGILDCLGLVKGIGGYEEVLADSKVVDLPVGKCRVITLDALIRAKEAVGRPNDLKTVTHLKLIQQHKGV